MGTALAALVAAGTGCPVEDNPTPPSVEISPVEGLAGTTFPVQVRGTNTHFDAETFVAAIDGAGARVGGVVVSGETAARLEVTIDPEATAGPRALRIEAPPDSFTATLEVREPGVEPRLRRIEPSDGVPNAELDLELTGEGTHFEPGVTTVLFPEGSQITVTSLSVDTPTRAIAHIRIGSDPLEGELVVVVVSRDEVVHGRFRVATSAQASVSVAPPEGFKSRDVDVIVSGSRADFGVAGDRALVSFEPGAGIRVSDVRVTARTRLAARFSVGANAQAGFQRFTVRIDPADQQQTSREYAGTFIVRAPGAPSVRLLPPALHRGETRTLVLEGHGTDFDDLLGVRPEADSGIELTGLWVLGPDDAAIRLRVDADAPLGARVIEVDDGEHDDLSSVIEILDADPLALEATPAFLQAGANDLPVNLMAASGDLQEGVTHVRAAARSGIAVGALAIESATTANATVSVQETAPLGRTVLELETAGDVRRAPVTVIPPGDAPAVTLDPPVVRAGLGPVELVMTVHGAALGAETVAEVSDPGIALTATAVDAEIAHLTVDVSRAAVPGQSVVVLADGAARYAASLEVLPTAVPSVSASPSRIVAGRAEQLVVVFGTDTTWLPGVTVAAPPMSRGITVDGLTVVDETTAVLELTVSSEAPDGSTGIILATHGEVAVAPLSVDAADTPPTAVLEPPSVEPGASATITVAIEGSSRDLRAGPVHAELPDSPEIRLVRTVVVDASTLALDVEVDPGATAGTRPIEVAAPGLDVRAGLAVREGGGPAVWITPMQLRPGRPERLSVSVDGLDLASGPVQASADSAEVLVGEVAVGETADTAEVDVTVDPDASIDSFWLQLEAGTEQVRHRLLVGPVQRQASTSGGPVEAGTRDHELLVSGDQTSFAPEETLVLPGAASDGLRFGRPVVGSSEQLRIAIDAAADVDANLGQVLIVTGSELVAAGVPLDRAAIASFDAPGDAHGSVLSDLGAILRFDGTPIGLLRLQVRPDAPETEMSLELIGPDGFAPIAPAVRSTTAIAYPLPAGAFARVAYAGDPIEGGDPLGFSFEARPLVSDAAAELEPNDGFDEAELFPDPVGAPTVMTCELGQAADVDTFVVTASSPVVFETFARRLAAGWAVPDIGIRAPLEAELVAPALGSDLVAVLEPRGRAEAVPLGLEGLAGSGGAYLVVARSAVVVNEIGWTADGGYIELRAAPGLALDGFLVRVLNAGGQALLPDILLDGAVAGEQGLLLLSPTELADLRVPDLDLPDDGAVTVRWDGMRVDGVAFGAAPGVEGEPIDRGEAVAVARRFGIDRNDNATDFEPVPPSPGTE